LTSICDARRAARGKDSDMITKFSTVYAGHIDLGDMGQLATPANDRRYPNERLVSVFEKTEAIARIASPAADRASSAHDRSGRPLRAMNSGKAASALAPRTTFVV
jgi:hypothetical protein